MVSAGGVDGELADESALAVDAELEVAGDDEDVLAGAAAVNADGVAVPGDDAVAADSAHAGGGRGGQGIVGCRWWGGVPPLQGCAPVGGLVGAVLVVVNPPVVELGLELGGR